MASTTHTLKGSVGTFPSVPSLWSRGSKLKHCEPAFHAVWRKDKFVSLKCRSCSSVGASLVIGPKSKSFRISAFKGSSCVGASLVIGPKSKSFRISAFKGSSWYDYSGDKFNGSKSLKNVEVSYLQHDAEESSGESSKVQNVVHAPCTSVVEGTFNSVTIQNLFKNWLMLLRTASQTQALEVHDELSFTETSEMPNTVKQQDGEILKAICCLFWGLDATIKIPFILFSSLYLAVNLAYGSRVSKELIPLWILGPLVLALYIKMFRAICGLYAFSFRQTVKVVKSLPVFCLLVRDYVVHGKLKEALKSCIVQPLADMKNMNYNEVRRRKTKDLQEWMKERYLDFVISIWPLYNRIVRLLRSTSLI